MNILVVVGYEYNSEIQLQRLLAIFVANLLPYFAEERNYCRAAIDVILPIIPTLGSMLAHAYFPQLCKHNSASLMCETGTTKHDR